MRFCVYIFCASVSTSTNPAQTPQIISNATTTTTTTTTTNQAEQHTSVQRVIYFLMLCSQVNWNYIYNEIILVLLSTKKYYQQQYHLQGNNNASDSTFHFTKKTDLQKSFPNTKLLWLHHRNPSKAAMLLLIWWSSRMWYNYKLQSKCLKKCQ